MSGPHGVLAAGMGLSLMVLLTLPCSAAAQGTPASAGSSAAPATMSMAGMDHAEMANMHMPAPAASSHKPVGDTPNVKAAIHQMDHGSMPGKRIGPAMGDSHDDPTADMGHALHHQSAMPDMSMGSMRGGHAPPGTRSPDYSDGVGYGAMQPDMAGDDGVGKLMIDQLEAFSGRGSHGQAWELHAWYGTDANKLWIRSGGEHSAGKVQNGEIEAFWNHAIAPFWGTQLGVRRDLGTGPGRTWAAFGVEGLAPYWFGVQATAYVGSSGRTAARLRVDYDVLFSQRLILTPELEFNLYGHNDPARGIGRGLSDVQLGLRLRYEIRRQFAPYIGVNWVRKVGTSAKYARAQSEPALDRQFVAGVRIWF